MCARSATPSAFDVLAVDAALLLELHHRYHAAMGSTSGEAVAHLSTSPPLGQDNRPAELRTATGPSPQAVPSHVLPVTPPRSAPSSALPVTSPPSMPTRPMSSETMPSEAMQPETISEARASDGLSAGRAHADLCNALSTTLVLALSCTLAFVLLFCFALGWYVRSKVRSKVHTGAEMQPRVTKSAFPTAMGHLQHGTSTVVDAVMVDLEDSRPVPPPPVVPSY